MSKNFISQAFDAVLAAKMKAEKRFQKMGRNWAMDTVAKQKLIDAGKYRLD